MNAIFDQLIEEAQGRLRNAAAQADAESRRAIAANFIRATHRLNEAEHALQFKGLGYFSQWFFYPYGSRRNASEKSTHDLKEYLAALPVEHRGIAGKWVDLQWDRGNA